MKIYNVVQGSPDWHALRARHDCASEAPVMMGASKKTTRTELVRMKATGDEKVFSAWVQEHLLDRGHEVEARARAMVEAEIGEDLYPATIGDDAEQFLASFDGITMSDEVGFECKLWNEELAAAVRAKATELPGGHEWQLEQQLMVNPSLQRIVFACSDGTPEKTVKTIYQRVAGRKEALVRGWAQFHEDVENYVHVETAPKAVAQAVRDLPAIVIDVKVHADDSPTGGRIAIVSSLTAFGDALKAYLAQLPKKPENDQDFADLEDATKRLKMAEDKLKLAEAGALARFDSVDEMRGMVAMLVESARNNRLTIEKLVDAEKARIRSEILAKAKSDFAEHIAKLNTRLGRPLMPTMPCDFAAAMKGKKTVAGLKDGVNVAMASAKIAASDMADRIQVNLACLMELASRLREPLRRPVAAVPEALRRLPPRGALARGRAQARRGEATRRGARAHPPRGRGQGAGQDRARDAGGARDEAARAHVPASRAAQTAAQHRAHADSLQHRRRGTWRQGERERATRAPHRRPDHRRARQLLRGPEQPGHRLAAGHRALRSEETAPAGCARSAIACAA
jgi:predicted phage-related endonuclease